ncbi:penicillin-binding protein 2 [Candidatus Parcubacteria bacterium]|nr:MAG: penicillin-binding protein 2 [Candidatus Parcubacteria bacterium]GIW68988.1 MAG: hypothetical protein KatS3mg100_482 [Candidatus Parcubacteria bacterium]
MPADRRKAPPVWEQRTRLFLVTLVLTGMWGWVGATLWQLQVVHGEEYAQKAHNRFARLEEDPIASRGSILARGPALGFVPLAQSANRFRVVLLPRELEKPEEVFFALHALYPELTSRQFDTWMEQDKPIDIGGEITLEEFLALREDIGDERGVRFVRATRRVYPIGSVAAHSIGVVGYKDSSQYPVGLYGIEAAYDATLSHAQLLSGKSWLSAVVGKIGSLWPTAETPKGDVVTTLDLELQAKLEQELDAVQEEWHAKEIGGIVLDPRDGRILAAAARPVFDPNNLTDNHGSLANPLTQRTYEFGSVMKPLTVALGLEAGVITPSTTYTDTGSATYNSATIRNHDGKARGTVDVQTILAQSLNVGAAWVATKLDPQWFLEKLSLMFGETSGVDLPEAPGSVTNVAAGVAAGRKIEIATASFGQGFRTSAVAMARALSALANGGVMPPVHIGASVITPLGKEAPIPPLAPAQRIVSEQAAHEVTQMLVRVVDETLAQGRYRDPAYATAAKTGTAQIARADGRGYRDDAYLHSFFGYFPAFAPRYVVFLYHLEPQGARYASETLTRPFMNLREYLLGRDVPPPDRKTAQEGDAVGNTDETR